MDRWKCAVRRTAAAVVCAASLITAGAAAAQSACGASLGAYTQAMQTATVEALQGYLDAHAPCFEDPVRKRLAEVQGAAPAAAQTQAQTPAQAPAQAPTPAPAMTGSGTGAGPAAAASIPKPVADPSCTTYANARSERWDEPVEFRVTNRTDMTLAVRWIDYDGNRQEPQMVDPGGVYGGGTYVTHPFEFTDPDGNCVKIVMPQAGVSDYVVGE